MLLLQTLVFLTPLQPRVNDSPSSSTLHGASPVTEHSSWWFRTPSTQQAVLSKPAVAPAVLHPVPPHLVHSRGQQALPWSFSPWNPARPLLHSRTGSVHVVVVVGHVGSEGNMEYPQTFCSEATPPRSQPRRCRMLRQHSESMHSGSADCADFAQVILPQRLGEHGSSRLLQST